MMEMKARVFRTRAWKFLATGAVIAATFLSAFAPLGAEAADAEKSGEKNQDLFVIRTQMQTVHNEIQIAELKGFFEEEGIKIEYVATVEGLSALQMLEQGLIDTQTNTHPNRAAQARIAGMKVRCAVPGMIDHPEYPHVRYFANADGNVKTLADIYNKKIAIQNYNSCYDGYLRTWLKEHKLPYDDVEWVTLPKGGQAEQALIEGLIDLTTTHPPFGGIVARAGAKQIATTWDIFKSPAAGLAVHIFHEDFMNAHPEEMKAFSRALYKARKWNNENMPEAIRLVGGALGLDVSTLSTEWDGRWYSEEPGFLKEDIDLWFQICEDLGYWNKGDVQPEDIYTNEYAPTKKL
jgi:ABC-type nitrate/sulfonate/bicarbonate transport system substrate-binding protein